MASSSFSNNSISIMVSDDDSDELGRKRVRARRKRKKHGHQRPRNELNQLLIRLFVKYWMLLIFLPAAMLIIFEVTSVGRKPGLVVHSEVNEVKSPNLMGNSELTKSKEATQGKKPDSKLNRLDPITHIVSGVREPCLKLLPAEELEHLDISEDEESTISSPVKRLMYISDHLTPHGHGGGNSTLSWQRTSVTRFNLFTGNQTFDEREKSFKVSETVALHCGFFSENGGFAISDRDKSYMQTCKLVVSTCAFGGGDDLYQPIGMSEASLKKVCYVAFWDETTLAAQESQGNKIGEDGLIGKWRIVIVRNPPFVDQRLNGKIPKMLPHRLFPHAKYSIWVDSKSQFRRDPLGVVEALLWRRNSVLAISEHGARSSVYDEAKAVVLKHKATPEEVEVQMTQYRKDGLPEDKRFNGKKALNEASVIVRKHTPLTNMFMCLWFNEVVRFTSRDQLSFPYVLWRLKVLKNINMFPVCTRRDLVNSMGHIRKAKPLTN
ncbi:30S ribosomal protein S9 [Hibiscus syriacus]|uniref:30S ribosomal protein S9 n=1 Tax=Hibiscus syriacus TaxID=106335 RepID=A0A6A3AZR9_HIBSY|nr:uncharacterized protein LOC120118581 [Hibiscus syriacus]XP_038994537.1 uncharacterized protein LOC120118581 [Hibiscus syriacus]KAE8709951.1 30S ribosomal protein S9 [Hibiscus syriacus]